MKFGIQCSGLSNRIHIGRLNKKEDTFLEKEDMTFEAVHAVAKHIEANIEEEDNNTVNLTVNGKVYSLTLQVKDV